MGDTSEKGQLLVEVLSVWDGVRASLDSRSARELRIIRTNMKKVLVMPKPKSDAQKNSNRLAQQRFYARQKERILEYKRLKREQATREARTASE
ncbi:unnamed protein product [Ectocarpus sp. 6 AP-2014]